ncbi:GtrA family protein [Lichenibacterium minor]|jgi:putative flippase GtrA|uniref:GtrA family protein n=1 Tax=Lichenibacterium minor TaxID=2316528 RepID=A0A4Q2UAA7_9HYPH|nr:GtrA family protein [Lichenibacterium minor]RYC32037.1 GtrA family protein [Lichenibacterium minor]
MNRTSLARRLRRPETRRFVAFLLTGGLAAAVNVASRVVFDLVMPYGAAVAVAYLVGMTTAFFLARLFVFEASGRSLHVEYGRFALVNVAALVQVLAVSLGLAELAFPALGLSWHAELIAHVIGVLSPVVVSYQGHKRFSFA